ncbi:MAG: hypothetical protein HYV90_02495 [Candidatus Woesebacteria bacterium]|nr:MAG: hypothetical protein HYV90_02495 [Candidatus Woesebacteria bacterium]
MKRNQLFIVGAALMLLVLVAIVVVPNVFKTTPKTTITCLGGQVFLADEGMQQRLLDEYNIEVKYVSSGSFEMKDKDLTGIDCAWPGSAPAAADFVSAHKDIVLKKDTMFRTFNLFFTRKDLGYEDAFIKAGYVYQKDGADFMPMAPIIEAMKAHKTWEEIGVQGVPGFVNIKYSAPESSGGGLQHLFLLCSYLMPGGENGGLPCDAANLGPVLPTLVDNWNFQGGQTGSSPEWFKAWLQNSRSLPLGASSESLFLGYYNQLPADQKKAALDDIVGIYSEWTIGTDHVFIAITPNGVRLLEILQSDPYFAQRAWDAYGMRTAFGGLGAKPGQTDVPWIVAEPLAISEPKQDATQMITCAINPAKCAPK